MASSHSRSDDESAGIEALQAALNAAAMRRSVALTKGRPVAPPLPKRKKDSMSKDVSKNAEKVTPDPKFTKSNTSSSFTSSSTPGVSGEDPVCNLANRLDAAAMDPVPGASGGAPAGATAVPDASAEAAVSPPVVEPMDVDTLYSLSGMNDDGNDESDSLSRMTTLPLSPSTMDALADRLVDHPANDPSGAAEVPCIDTIDATAAPSKALVEELAIHGSEQIPVATPSRALAEFWGRYRKPKPHVNPMMPAGSTSEETSASTNPMMDSSAVHPTDPVTPAGTEGTVHSTVVPSSTGPTDGAVSGGADASTGVPVDGAVSGGADASTGVPVHVGLDKRGSSSSFASEEIESGWRYDEKCKKREAKLAQAVPGDAAPDDGPTIPTMNTTSVLEEPSTGKVVATDAGTTPVPAEASTGPVPVELVIAEYEKLATDQVLDAKAAELQKMDDRQITFKVLELQKHPSCQAFSAYVMSLGQKDYVFGNMEPIDEIAAFEIWQQAELNCSTPVPPVPQVPEPETPRTSALRAVLTRATTVDLAPAHAAKQPHVKVEPVDAAPSVPPSVPAPSSVEASPQPSTEQVAAKIMRAKKAKWHRSMKSNKCPPAIKKLLEEIQSRGEGGARDQAAWDNLFNKFVECGEDWTKCDLVSKSVSVHEKSQTGTWALMSKKDLDDKYGDEDTVKDLIGRKTALGQFESNPDFPDREDLRVYWCWKTTIESDKSGHLNEVGVASNGRIDAATAKALASNPIAAPTPVMDLKSAATAPKAVATPKAGGAKPKPKKEPKAKPVPKAKSPVQEATNVMKSAATVILECKSWRAKLTAAGLPSNMVEAMVQDTGVYLENIQKNRDSLEAMIAEGKPEVEIHAANQSLAQHIKDYKIAAAHVKRHCSKPKKAKEPDQLPAPAEAAE